MTTTSTSITLNLSLPRFQEELSRFVNFYFTRDSTDKDTFKKTVISLIKETVQTFIQQATRGEHPWDTLSFGLCIPVLLDVKALPDNFFSTSIRSLNSKKKRDTIFTQDIFKQNDLAALKQITRDVIVPEAYYSAYDTLKATQKAFMFKKLERVRKLEFGIRVSIEGEGSFYVDSIAGNCHVDFRLLTFEKKQEEFYFYYPVMFSIIFGNYKIPAWSDTLYQAFLESFIVSLSKDGKPVTRVLDKATASDASDKKATPPDYLFCNEGDEWKIVYRGKPISLRDSYGLRYIAYLLSKPWRPIHVFELVKLAHPTDPSFIKQAHAEDPEQGLPPKTSSRTKGRSSATALLNEYHDEYKELQSKLDRANYLDDKIEKQDVQKKMQMLLEKIGSTQKYRSKGEDMDPMVKKAQVSVYKCIQRALVKIEKKHPDIHKHLTATIWTGFYCHYNPDPENTPHWVL